MNANDKIAALREKLDAIAPLPEDGAVTARALARHFAVRSQERFTRMLSPVSGGPDGQQVSAMCAEFAAAHALLALADAAAGLADDCAAQIRDALEDGGGIGEWLWEHLGGTLAEKVAAVAEDMAVAQAAEAVTADA